jgi:hypothetical protein
MRNTKAEGRRRCTVCHHAERAQIELLIARGASRRAVAKRFPDLSADSIYRHWNKHVPEHVKAAQKVEVLKPGAELEKLVEQESIGLLNHLQRIRSALYVAFDAAAEAGDRHGLSQVASQLHHNLRLAAQKTGELQQHSQTQINNLILAPDYLNLRARLIATLRPYPEVARAVAEAFREIESGAPPQGPGNGRMIDFRAVEVPQD